MLSRADASLHIHRPLARRTRPSGPRSGALEVSRHWRAMAAGGRVAVVPEARHATMADTSTSAAGPRTLAVNALCAKARKSARLIAGPLRALRPHRALRPLEHENRLEEVCCKLAVCTGQLDGSASGPTGAAKTHHQSPWRIPGRPTGRCRQILTKRSRRIPATGSKSTMRRSVCRSRTPSTAHGLAIRSTSAYRAWQC